MKREMVATSEEMKRKLAAKIDKTKKLLFLVTQPPPMYGGMAEDYGAPEAGQLPKAWTRGRKGIKSRQRASGAKSL